MLVSVLKGEFYVRSSAWRHTNRACYSYVLFSISNVESLFSMTGNFGMCWDTTGPGPTCNQNWVAAASYLEIVGILLGQMVVGYLGDS